MNSSSEIHKHYENQIRPVVRRITDNHFSHMRSSAIGGSSVSLAIILLLLQVGIGSVPLKISLFSAVVAVPAWVAAWQYVEAYIFYGKSSLEHFSSVKGSGVAVLLFLIGGTSLLVSLASMVWHMSATASAVFLVSSVFVVIVTFKHNNSVKLATEETEAASIS